MLMSAHTRLTSLQRKSLLSVLEENDRAAVLRRSRVTELRRRERLYETGDPASDVYLVESGVVKLAVESPDGREAILGFQHPGNLVGEMALIEDGPHDHLAEAYEDTVVWAIARDLFLGLMRSSPALSFEVTRLLGQRMRMLRTRVREILHQNAHARVAHTLVHLAGRHGVEDADGVVIPLRLSQRTRPCWPTPLASRSGAGRLRGCTSSRSARA